LSKKDNETINPLVHCDRKSQQLQILLYKTNSSLSVVVTLNQYCAMKEHANFHLDSVLSMIEHNIISKTL